MKLIHAIAFLNCYRVQWHRTRMKQTQAQKSGILEQDPLPWHQEEMSKQLLNYSLQKKKERRKNLQKEGKHPYKKWSHFKEKKFRRLQKESYSVYKADKIFAKKFLNSSLLVPLSLQRSRFLGHNCLASPPKTSTMTFKLHWQGVKKRKKEAKNQSWISQQTLRLGGVFSSYPFLSVFIC